MANIVETPVWENTIYEIGTSDPVLGGNPIADIGGNILGGHSNVSIKQLANRTSFLRDQVAASDQALSDHSSAVNPHPQYILTDNLYGNLPVTAVSVFSPLQIIQEDDSVTGQPTVFTVFMSPATTSVDGYMSATDKQTLDGLVAASQSGAVVSVNGQTGVVTLTKASFGLSNVDDTSDLSKPISTATQAALNAKLSDAPSDGKLYARQNGNWVSAGNEVFLSDVGAVGGVNGQIVSLDIASASFFTASLALASTNTEWTLNFSFNNIPDSSSKVVSWHVEVIAGNKRTINWPSNVRWASNTPPTFNGGRTVIMFYRMLNRANIYGMVVDQGNV